MTVTLPEVATLTDQVIGEIEKAVVGKQEVLRMIMAACLTSGGHVLIEDYRKSVV